ncbi:MAG: hypothetical protein IKC27_03390 [Kiritimatiellae bacterium]|nr:hypothetical protein [Kiritimatiellia bacterium]
MNIKILSAIAASAFLIGCAAPDCRNRKTFTLNDFKSNEYKVVLPKNASTCRISVEYTAKKKFSFTAKPSHNAFVGLSRISFPASETLRKESRDFKVVSPDYGDLMLILNNPEDCDIKTLSVEPVPAEKYAPSTIAADPLRKNNNRHIQIKKDYEKAPSSPIILFGDSLTDNWRGKRFEYMAKNFTVINAGICGDKVEHLLWRILDMHQILSEKQPEAATFLIGTNNFSYQYNPEDIALGVKNLIATFRAICPNTKIIVFAIPPRGFVTRPDMLPFTDVTNPLIENAIDELKASNERDVYYFDFGDLLAEKRMIKKEFYENDKLHFSDKGYAEVLTPFISGAIRLVTSKNLPADYFRKMTAWERYLKKRYMTCRNNLALEEMLACETHLKSLAPHWMNVFKKISEDDKYIPEMPAEYLRQARQEGLPEFLR